MCSSQKPQYLKALSYRHQIWPAQQTAQFLAIPYSSWGIKDLLNIYLKLATQGKSSPEPRWSIWWRHIGLQTTRDTILSLHLSHAACDLFLLFCLHSWPFSLFSGVSPSHKPVEPSSCIVRRVMEGWAYSWVFPLDPWLTIGLQHPPPHTHLGLTPHNLIIYDQLSYTPRFSSWHNFYSFLQNLSVFCSQL